MAPEEVTLVQTRKRSRSEAEDGDTHNVSATAVGEEGKYAIDFVGELVADHLTHRYVLRR